MIVRRRSNNQIQAHRVDHDNIGSLAIWCGGSIKGMALPPDQRVIDIQTHDREIRAEIGDWIVHEGGTFAVYHNAGFNGLFVRDA